ncbi:MAG: TIGR01777 family oxidoreductase, partial [Myxococcota bacterium]
PPPPPPPPPSVLVSASAVGYYGSRGDEALSEESSPGDDFLARLCVDWEAAAREAESASTRVACVRIGIVLDPDGGALAKMLPPFRLGIGGPLGPAGRWFPWVHGADVVGILCHAAKTRAPAVLNAVAPEAVTMGEFARALGRTLHRPALLPVPIAPLRLLLGEFAGYLSPGQRVAPAATLASGYAFRFPRLADALADCLAD